MYFSLVSQENEVYTIPPASPVLLLPLSLCVVLQTFPFYLNINGGIKVD